MMGWTVILVWSLLAGMAAGFAAFAGARGDGDEYLVARAKGRAAFAAGWLITSMFLAGLAWVVGLL